MTAMAFCGAHRQVLEDRVDGLVFVATRAHQTFPPYVDRAARRLVAQGQAQLEAGRPRHRSLTGARVVRLAFGSAPSSRAVEIVAEMGESIPPEFLLPSVAGLIEHDARSVMAETHTPAMVIVGTRDLLTPVPAGRHLANLLGDAEFVVLPRAGHQLMQERPDELAELIDAFVGRVEAADRDKPGQS